MLAWFGASNTPIREGPQPFKRGILSPTEARAKDSYTSPKREQGTLSTGGFCCEAAESHWSEQKTLSVGGFCCEAAESHRSEQTTLCEAGKLIQALSSTRLRPGRPNLAVSKTHTTQLRGFLVLGDSHRDSGPQAEGTSRSIRSVRRSSTRRRFPYRKSN